MTPREEQVEQVEQVYATHATVVRRALRSFGVDASSLDDAVQDVFVVLVRRAAEFDPGGRSEQAARWTNWLWGIARRVARGYRRGADRRERLHAVLPAQMSAATLDDELARRRALEFLDAFAAALPPALLEAFVLAELEGCTAPEIAVRTGVNLNTIYARIRAVRRRFDDAIAAELAPTQKTGAWWLFGVPWWTPAAATACVALTIGFAEVAIELASPRAVATADASPTEPRNAAVPAKDPDMSSSRKLAAPLAVGIVAASLVAPTVEAKPKPRRAKTEAVQPKAETSDQDADEAARRGTAGDITIYDYEGDTVNGERLSPEGFNVLSRGDVKMESLLRIRGHFIRELIVMGTDV